MTPVWEDKRGSSETFWGYWYHMEWLNSIILKAYAEFSLSLSSPLCAHTSVLTCVHVHAHTGTQVAY